MAAQRRIRIAIAEDDRHYRNALETVLSLSSAFEVLGSFPTASDLLEAARREPQRAAAWDIVLMDLEMPGIGGIDATRALKRLTPAPSVVVITVFEEPATILKAICAGADGYLLKKTPAAEIMEQLQLVFAGGATLTPGVARTVLELVRMHTPSDSPEPTRLDLTSREQQVLRCLVAGESYKQVASALEISLDTVRSHIRALYKKLQVQSATAAVGRAIREGLV